MTIRCPKCKLENPDDTQFCGHCAASLKTSGSPSHTETLEMPQDLLTTGSMLAGRYQIIERLGEGGMGRVYKALDTEINATLALKIIKPEISSDRRNIEGLRNELKLARDIIHKNICRMYDIHKNEGVYYITMEYVPGQDLKSLIRQTGHLAIPTVISIGLQVCAGLEEAHKMGVIHRDLKPHNTMIDTLGHVRIMDFGIASSLRSNEKTSHDTIIGSPAYMSPEQASAQSLDQRSDIYSLGVILYEMATGEQPFQGTDPIVVALKHKSEEVKAPRELNPKLPEGLNQVILKCLAKDRERRFQSALDLSFALKNLQILSESQEKPREAIRENSIAVLPFADLSPQGDQEYFCDGMAEELINVLSRIKELDVVARTSSFSFKGRNVDVREIGKRLGVRKVLEGSVRKSGTRLRITAQLIDTSQGYHVWSESFDRDLDDVFAIQDQVTMAIIEKFDIKLVEKDKKQLRQRRTQDAAEYQAYLKGRFFLNNRTEEGFRDSISYFQQMIEKNPESALGYAGLAEAYNSLGYFNYMPAAEAYAKAREWVELALAKDDTLAAAHVSLAGIKIFYDWDLADGERSLRRALKLNEANIEARHRLAFALSALERHEEAVQEINRALEQDPLSSVINSAAAWINYLARDYDLALDRCAEILKLDPHFHVSYVIRGLAFMEKQQLEEAISSFQRALELEKNDAATLAYLCLAYSRADRKKDAERILHESKELSDIRYIAPLYRAIIFSGLGQDDLALEWLERGLKERTPWMIFLRAWPIFDRLRAEARFESILDGLKSE